MLTLCHYTTSDTISKSLCWCAVRSIGFLTDTTFDIFPLYTKTMPFGEKWNCKLLALIWRLSKTIGTSINSPIINKQQQVYFISSWSGRCIEYTCTTCVLFYFRYRKWLSWPSSTNCEANVLCQWLWVRLICEITWCHYYFLSCWKLLLN